MYIYIYINNLYIHTYIRTYIHTYKHTYITLHYVFKNYGLFQIYVTLPGKSHSFSTPHGTSWHQPEPPRRSEAADPAPRNQEERSNTRDESCGPNNYVEVTWRSVTIQVSQDITWRNAAFQDAHDFKHYYMFHCFLREQTWHLICSHQRGYRSSRPAHFSRQLELNVKETK